MLFLSPEFVPRSWTRGPSPRIFRTMDRGGGRSVETPDAVEQNGAVGSLGDNSSSTCLARFSRAAATPALLRRTSSPSNAVSRRRGTAAAAGDGGECGDERPLGGDRTAVGMVELD